MLTALGEEPKAEGSTRRPGAGAANIVEGNRKARLRKWPWSRNPKEEEDLTKLGNVAKREETSMCKGPEKSNRLRGPGRS